MGLLDGSDNSGALGSLLSGVVDPDSIRALQQQNAWNNLITTMGAIGAASGPSPRPVPLGSVFGQGALAGQEAQRQNIRDTLGALYTGQAIKGAGINNALNMLNLRGWQGILSGGGNPGTGVAPGGLLNPGGGGPGLLGATSPEAAAAASAKGPVATALNAPPGVSVRAPASPGTTFESPGTPEGQPTVTLGVDDVRAARSPTDAAATAAKIDQAVSGSSSPPAGGSSQPVPVLDPATLIARARQYMTFPAGLTTANQLLSMAQKMMPEGTVLMSDGSVALPKGADQAMMTRALAEKGFTRGADGYFHPDPGYVAGQAQITSAQEWAKVGPQLYEKGHEPFDLSRPGAIRAQVGPDGKTQIVAQNPIMTESVDADGTPQRVFVNPPVVGAGGLLNPPPSAPAPGGLLNPGPRPLAFRDAVPPQAPASTAPQPAPGSQTTGQASSLTPSGTPGVSYDAQGRPVIKAGLSPLATGSIKTRAENLESFGKEIDERADSAKQTNYLIDNMRDDAQTWRMGKFADAQNNALAYLQGFGQAFNIDTSGIDKRIGDFQSFNKAAMELTRQVVRQTSSRAAVQEFQLIQQALPNAEMSKGGFDQIANQLQATNDYHIAQSAAAQNWRSAHNGTLAGFEQNWNANVSPGAFLFQRLSLPDRQALADRLGQTPAGRAAIAHLRAQIQYAGQAGLFDAGR